MSGPTIRYRVRFRGRGESALVAPRACATGTVAMGASGDSTAPTAGPGAPTPAARVLALAYAVERQVRTGALRNYREAARRLGVSHARMSQIVALLLLAPRIQADVISGQATWSEVRLRATSLRVHWAEQGPGLRDHARRR